MAELKWHDPMRSWQSKDNNLISMRLTWDGVPTLDQLLAHLRDLAPDRLAHCYLAEWPD